MTKPVREAGLYVRLLSGARPSVHPTFPTELSAQATWKHTVIHTVTVNARSLCFARKSTNDRTLGELFRKIENSKAGQYLGIDLPGEEIGKTNEGTITAAEEQQEKMAVNKLKYNGFAQQAGIDIMQGVGTSIPSLILPLVTAGMGESGTMAASTASVAGDTKISDMIANYIMNLAKAPQYWMSFARMEGDTYASAIAEGATEAQASQEEKIAVRIVIRAVRDVLW